MSLLVLLVCALWVAATTPQACELDKGSARAWIEGMLSDMRPGGSEALNAQGLLFLLRGERDAAKNAASAFRKAWERDAQPSLSRLAIAKNLWWAEMVAETPSEERSAAAQEEVFTTFLEIAKEYEPAAASRAVMSIFELPLQATLCDNPFYHGGIGGSANQSNFRDRYLDLLKRSLTNYLYREQATLREQEWDVNQGSSGVFDFDIPAQGHTVMRVASLSHLQLLAGDLLARGIPGDVLEAGCFRGGGGVLLRAAFDADVSRVIWMADTFEGIPLPHSKVGREIDETIEWTSRYEASKEQVQDTFRRYGYGQPDGRVRYIVGGFNETLKSAPFEQLALVHVDADSHDSVLDALTLSYKSIVPGGYIVIDDYHLHGVRTAVATFRSTVGITSPVLPVPSDRVSTCTPDLQKSGTEWDHTATPLSAAYWRK
jgi:hypothetical protein